MVRSLERGPIHSHSQMIHFEPLIFRLHLLIERRTKSERDVETSGT